METIGILECSSIAKGVEAADAILKAAEVSLLYAKPVCPGKYTVLVCGDVAAVQAALEAGERTADGYLVDSVVIPRVHPQVVQAIHQAAPPSGQNAVGIMEFFSVTAAVFERQVRPHRAGAAFKARCGGYAGDGSRKRKSHFLCRRVYHAGGSLCTGGCGAWKF